MTIDPRFIEGELRGETPPQPDLSDLRETILEAMDSVHDMDVTFADYADAIVRALPRAIKPLEWSKTEHRAPDHDGYRANGAGVRYAVIAARGGAKCVLSSSGAASIGPLHFDTLEAAKAAAQAHHAAAILRGLGIAGEA